MEVNGSGREDSRQVQIRFVTKLAAPLKAPTASIAVPSDVNRMSLSEIVNLLLQNGDPDFQPQPFDFLIDGELVRLSLGEFLLAKGISAEKILEIEYIKAVAPQKQEEPCMHDDWVSAVAGSSPSFVLTGCYDSIGRIWKPGGLCTHTLVGHSDAITSVSIINPEGGENGTTCHCVTASKDHTLRLWKFDAADTSKCSANITAFKVLSGHASSVQSVAAAPSREMICSGSWDCSIKLWSTVYDVDGDSVLKKRKVNAETTSCEESQMEGEAISSLEGHRQCVSSVIWPDQETIYSASWDHGIRRWDVETGKDFLNLVCGKALNCIDVGGEGSALIAAGGSDPILRIWDPRKPGTLAPVFQFSSHSSWITACKWHAKSWFHLISASYDGKVMLWDLRTAVMSVLCGLWQ